MYRKTITIALLLFLSFNSFAQQDGANKKEEYYAKKKKMMETPPPFSLSEIEQANSSGNTMLINILPGLYYFQGNHNMGVYLVEDKFTLIDTQEEDNMDRNLNIIKRKTFYIDFYNKQDLKSRTLRNLLACILIQPIFLTLSGSQTFCLCSSILHMLLLSRSCESIQGYFYLRIINLNYCG